MTSASAAAEKICFSVCTVSRWLLRPRCARVAMTSAMLSVVTSDMRSEPMTGRMIVLICRE